MKKIIVVAVTGLVGIFAPLATMGAPISNAPNPEITNADDFDNLATHVEQNLGKRVKIAGQKIRVEETPEGLFVVAEFLPYPNDDLHFTDSAIGKPKPTKARGRFTFLYPGKKNVTDPILTWKGNRFILLGDIKGQKQVPVTLTGKKLSVPYFVAHCVRVWKTGGSEVGSAPDDLFGAYPPLARTFCFD
jgi:hypothetical protein